VRLAEEAPATARIMVSVGYGRDGSGGRFYVYPTNLTATPTQPSPI
jgi:hypothetical protein